jgi:hypothetical protein
MLEIEVRVKGKIGKQWSDWLGGVSITHTEQGNSVLTGRVRDHAALYGLLSTLSDLGLLLISVSTLPWVEGHLEIPGTGGNGGEI